MHIAVDAWDLAVRPSSLEAWRTRELLELRGPAVDGWRWSLIGPATEVVEVPANVRFIGTASPRGGRGRLLFEQLALPRAASRIEAGILLTLAGSLPLSSRVPLVMEAYHGVPAGSGVSDRLRRATRAAASLGATTFMWADLPERVPNAGAAIRLPPWVAERFRPAAEAGDAPIRTRLGLADGYVLSFAVGERDATRLLSAWSWVAPSVGQAHPLVVAGMHVDTDPATRLLADRLGLADTLRLVDKLAYADLPAVMRGAAVLLVPGKPADGQLLRWALACGAPVAAAAMPESGSILGEAAYVAPADDPRALGAACLSLLVDDNLAESLKAAGARRAGSYHSGRGVEELAGLLRRAAHPH